jgi:pSer/pThr/pTyr-binding forkhead associated (FHA) protein
VEHRTVQVIFKGQVLQSVPLDRPMLTIGRLKENDVVIDNLSVSRLHARIVLEGERVFLEDQGSGNGCLVNGRRVDRAPIAPGDEILIGKHELVLVEPGDGPEAGDAAPSPSGGAEHSPWDGAHTYFLPQAEAPPKEEEPVERHAGLILQCRGELERVVSVERTPFVIGRAPECDLVLTESGVSRQHARIVLEGDDFVLEDLGGVNGTLVGGEPAERRALEIGDEIALDVYQITFVLEDRPIAEEIHVSAASNGASEGNAHETAFAETQPPGGGVISDEGSTHASGLQDLGTSGESDVLVAVSAEASLHDVEIAPAEVAIGSAPAELPVEPCESTLITGGAEEELGEAIEEPAAESSVRLALELEMEPDGLPEALREALLAACDAGLTLPVTLRLRRS